ncbi:energy transducer TonB [Sphingomonas chungangi]|uniref:energy transducer TonB n=1 Tax=Sphingomonas chungangi TaxID=2683589 RepID=UPI0031B57F91
MLPLLLAAAAISASAAAVPIEPGNWVSSDDYPAKAMADRTQGDVAFRVEIDVNGKPDACGILNSSGSQELDVATCDAVLTNAHFKPAIGQDSKPIRAYYSSVVRWTLPEDAMPWESSVAFVHVELNGDGSVINCTEGPPKVSRIGGCTAFGRAALLSQVVASPLAKLRSVEVRFVQDASGRPAVADPIPAAALRNILGRWTLVINPAGKIESCRKEENNTPTSFMLDFCDPSGLVSSAHYAPLQSGPSRTLHVTLETVTQPR